MFKERLKEFFAYLIGIPVVLLVLIGASWLVIEFLPIDAFLVFMRSWFPYALGIFISLVLLYKVWEFIKWLIIEPYKEHMKNKVNKI